MHRRYAQKMKKRSSTSGFNPHPGRGWKPAGPASGAPRSGGTQAGAG